MNSLYHWSLGRKTSQTTERWHCNALNTWKGAWNRTKITEKIIQPSWKQWLIRVMHRRHKRETLLSQNKYGIFLTTEYTTQRRRGILSNMSLVFDPLGFIAPFILEGKKIVQELCKDNVHWDKSVSETTATRWLKWKSSVRALLKFIVDRCYHPKDLVVADCHKGVAPFLWCKYRRLWSESVPLSCEQQMWHPLLFRYGESQSDTPQANDNAKATANGSSSIHKSKWAD